MGRREVSKISARRPVCTTIGTHGDPLRALTFLPLALAASVLILQVASCDTGGEPPGALPDALTEDAPAAETTPRSDSSGEPQDVKVVDSPISDTLEPGDGPCGTSGNSCCTHDAAPCGAGTTCQDNICLPPCGDPGQKCCAADTCNSKSSVCTSKHFCTACGGSSQPCCALNVCAGGGCCMGGYCSPQGTECAGTDGGTCKAGGCGSCGSPGQPCCEEGCTAPQTFCQGAVAAVDAGSESGGGSSGSSGVCAGCGAPGESCCASSCAGSYVCDLDAGGVCVCSTSTCEPDGGGD